MSYEKLSKKTQKYFGSFGKSSNFASAIERGCLRVKRAEVWKEKINIFFWNILSIQKNVVTLQSVSTKTETSSLKDWKQQKCSISTR